MQDGLGGIFSNVTPENILKELKQIQIRKISFLIFNELKINLNQNEFS